MFKEFNEFTLIWILCSSIVGGIVGASFKFIFELILTSRYNINFEANEALKRFKFPLFQSAQSLHRRLDFLIKNKSDRDLYNGESRNEFQIYKLSTLYVFCNFFGNCHIIETEALQKFYRLNRKSKQFYITFYNVYKGFSSMYYFGGVKPELNKTYEESTIPRFILSAIGEHMIKTNGKETRTIGFNSFVELIQTNNNFRNWIKYLDNLIYGIDNNKNDKDWNRILIIATHLRILENFLDKKRNFTHESELYEYISMTKKNVKNKLLLDIINLKKNKIIKMSSESC